MAFEQNQQNQFNMNNGIDQVKQFQAELDKATASIGAAELAAEEELQHKKLDNLLVLQNEKLKKLKELAKLEEDKLYELADLRLSLSDIQFEACKKEIQKELELAKKAMEELASTTDNLKKTKKSSNQPKSQSVTEDIAAASKSKSSNVTAAEQKNTSQPELVKVLGSLDNTLKALQKTITVYSSQKPLVDEQVSSGVAEPMNTQSEAVIGNDDPKQIESKEKEKKENYFSADASLLDPVDLGHYSAEAVLKTFDGLRDSMSTSIKVLLDQVTANNGNNVSQDTTDFAGDLLKSYKAADAAEEKAKKLTFDRAENGSIIDNAHNTEVELNRRLLFAEEEHKLRRQYAEEEAELAREGLAAEAKLTYINENEKRLLEQETARLLNARVDEETKRREEHIKALARSTEFEQNRPALLEDAIKKLADGHTDKQNDLKQAAIDNDAKTEDLNSNRPQYELEARMELENELAAKRNRLTEDLIKKEEALKFTALHRTELLEQQRQERENRYLEEYQEHLLTAGDYAVSLEEYKADQERKRKDKAKEDTVSDITSELKKFGSGKFSMTDIKKSYGEYIGQRTAELNTFDREARAAELRQQNPGLSDEELQKQLNAESEKAEASAKVSAQFELLAAAAGNLMDALDADVRKIAEMQGFVDTRLQGSRDNEQKGLSYWKQLLQDAKSIAGASPFIKQEKLVNNIKTLVDKGISFDIKQRAFLMTVQEKIANTFDVADGTLLRLIRIQQQDTTAGRLGMESALNSFLNSMYETSEYLESVAASVRGSLEEMQALMEGKDAVELEYQVQKWMGSLFSVGMSDSAVQSIAQTFGQIASGDISGITGSGVGNLIIMAANEAGMSIADILQDGLKADETNKLMQAMVNYLAEIAETSSDSRVVQQQLANVYGLKASDLRAATNLSSSIKDVAKSDKTYFDMMLQLNSMVNTMGLRTSVSEGMTNMWDNIMYSMASTQASNPILYLLPKMANLLKDVTGGDGIALPFLNVAGFGVDLNTSVADLMLVASMAGTALGALGPAISGLTDLVNPLAGSAMMMKAGINPLDGLVRVIARGTPATLQNMRGASTSESGSLVGNSSGEDIKNATLQDAEDSKKSQLVEAKEEESADDIIIKSQQAVIDIYNLLEEVAHGSQSLRVRIVGGSNAGGGSYGGGGGSAGQIVGDTAGAGSTGAGIGTGTDNGNWVFSSF